MGQEYWWGLWPLEIALYHHTALHIVIACKKVRGWPFFFFLLLLGFSESVALVVLSSGEVGTDEVWLFDVVLAGSMAAFADVAVNGILLGGE